MQDYVVNTQTYRDTDIQTCYTSGGSRGGSLGSDEPPSGRVWWLKTLELHGCIKVVQ